ncbi:hypothetical protein TYRP_005138, partial [Tyrophagus putrescentiae]
MAKAKAKTSFSSLLTAKNGCILSFLGAVEEEEEEETEAVWSFASATILSTMAVCLRMNEFILVLLAVAVPGHVTGFDCQRWARFDSSHVSRLINTELFFARPNRLSSDT